MAPTNMPTLREIGFGTLPEQIVSFETYLRTVGPELERSNSVNSMMPKQEVADQRQKQHASQVVRNLKQYLVQYLALSPANEATFKEWIQRTRMRFGKELLSLDIPDAGAASAWTRIIGAAAEISESDSELRFIQTQLDLVTCESLVEDDTTKLRDALHAVSVCEANRFRPALTAEFHSRRPCTEHMGCGLDEAVNLVELDVKISSLMRKRKRAELDYEVVNRPGASKAVSDLVHAMQVELSACEQGFAFGDG